MKETIMLTPENDLIGEIYEASSQPKHWKHVLKIIAENIDADSATLIYRDFDNTASNISFVYTKHTLKESEKMIAEYENHYHRFDPMWRLAAENARIGVAIADSQLGLKREEYEAHCPAEYLEYMRKYDLWHIGGSYLFQDKDKALVVAVQRGINSQPWTDKEMTYLTSLTPHLQRAFRIHREFSGLRSSVSQLKSCVDRLLMGLIIIQPNGKITFINELAQEIIKANPVLTYSNGKLKAIPAHNDNQLQQLITRTQTVTLEPDGDLAEAVVAIALKIDISSALLPILITPMKYDLENTDVETGTSNNQTNNHIAIFLADPERSQQYSQDVISAFYGLTQAEAAVAIAISNGHTVARYAEENNITGHTVRTQIKHIFQKLNISRQAELVKILLQTPNITMKKGLMKQPYE